jgi:hypothetical protein
VAQYGLSKVRMTVDGSELFFVRSDKLDDPYEGFIPLGSQQILKAHFEQQAPGPISSSIFDLWIEMAQYFLRGSSPVVGISPRESRMPCGKSTAMALESL